MRTSCIRLRAKSRIAVLYEDFLEILGGNMLAALLLAILVYWTDVKIGKKESNLWIWKSHTDFQDDLLFDKEGMKPPHRTTIKSALDLLVEKKFVYRRKNAKMPLDQTKQYLVDQTAVQAAIDALPPIVVLPTLESRNSDIALSNKQQSLSEKQQCNAEIPTSNTSDYITEITNPVITEEGESVFASAPTPPAEMPSENEYHFAGTEQQHLIWNCRNWCAVNSGTCEDYQAAIEAGLHERPTDKMPVVPPNVTPVSHSQMSIPDDYMQGEDNATRPSIQSYGAPHHRDAPDTDTRDYLQDDPRYPGLLPSQAVAQGETTDGRLSQSAYPDVGSDTATGEHSPMEMPRQRDAAGGDHADAGHSGSAAVSAVRRGAAAVERGSADSGAAVQAPSRAGAVPTSAETQDVAPGQLREGTKPMRNGKAPVAPVPIPIEALVVLDDWDSLFKKPIARTEKHVHAALDLVPCHPSRDDLKACKDWLFTTDNPQKPWFKKIGVKLRDVADNFGAWQSVQPSDPTEDELEEYSIPWFLAQQARRQAQELQA